MRRGEMDQLDLLSNQLLKSDSFVFCNKFQFWSYGFKYSIMYVDDSKISLYRSVISWSLSLFLLSANFYYSMRISVELKFCRHPIHFYMIILLHFPNKFCLKLLGINDYVTWSKMLCCFFCLN